MLILSLVAALIATSGRAIALPSLHSRTAGPEIDKPSLKFYFIRALELCFAPGHLISGSGSVVEVGTTIADRVE
jgi:hypothetical protein